MITLAFDLEKARNYAFGIMKRFRLHAENFSAFTAIQVASYLIPILTIPYFSRVLTIDGMGQIAIASAIGLSAGVLMDYGVLQSGARYAAKNSSNLAALNNYLVVSTALKLSIFAALMIVFFIVFLLFSEVKNDFWVYFWSMISAATTSLFPIWLYQGLLIVPKAARILVTTRFFAAGLSVILIRSPDDTYVVPMAQSLVGLIALLASGTHFHQILPMKSSSTVLNDMRKMIFDNWKLFSATKWGLIHVYGSTIIVAIMLPIQSVGLYSIAEKLSQAFVSIFNIGAQTTFPGFVKRFSNEMDGFEKSIRLYIIIISLISFLTLALVFSIRYEIYLFFAGKSSSEGVNIFSIWLFSSFFTVISVSLTPVMVAMHQDSSLAKIYRFTGLTFLVIAPIMVHLYGAIGMAIAALYPQSFMAVYLLVAVHSTLKVVQSKSR
jgi:PST family polysaccharide transporter